MRALKPGQRMRDERGSSPVIEAVIGMPAFALFVGLIIMGGRIEVTRQAVEAAAFEGARSASLARTQGAAVTSGRAAAADNLNNLPCTTTGVRVDAAGYNAPLGTTVLVGVTVTCKVGLADLSLPGVPGHRVITETAYSPIDAFRERR